MTTTQIMPGIRRITKPDANKPRKFKSAKKIAPTEQEANYKSALELVARIDEDLTRGHPHYRTRAGELLTTLDLVVVAILSDNLAEAGTV